jgi:hypothetical protein
MGFGTDHFGEGWCLVAVPTFLWGAYVAETLFFSAAQ